MKSLKNFSWIVLINIFLVVIAGSVVRMTGSGMGCPDWPKCFGYLVPPTSESQLIWEEGKEFEKSQMIIKDSSLWESKSRFIAGDSYDENNWKKYTKHDYAIFNVYHTWTEYINRLFGALLGVFALIMVFFAFKERKRNKWFLWLALIQLFLIGFEAWLGKLTVDTNLNVNMITYHMMGVTLMIIVQLLLLRIIKREVESNSAIAKFSKPIYYISISGIALMIIQIVLGTQVRQQTDEMMDAGISRELIADGFDVTFFIHRSFSFLIVFAIGYLYLKLRTYISIKRVLNYLIIFTFVEVLAGIILYYFGMQAYAQPIHLLLGLLIFSFFVELYLRLRTDLQSSSK